MTEERAKEIAALNDSFRAACGLPSGPPVSGRYVVTRGVAALALPFQLAALEQVRNFSAFTPDNDPYGEHDFGAFELEETGEKLFWKIDYFGGPEMTTGAEDPSDVAGSYRVLTLMLANEY